MTATRYIVTSRPVSNARRASRGFTLLELLIAAALSSVLLAVVWQTLATHSRLYEKRGESTERALVARAIRYQFLSDLDHLVRTPAAARRQSDAPVSQSESLPYGLRGDRHTLELAILEPAWHAAENEIPAAGQRTDFRLPGETRQPSPIRMVRYHFVGATNSDDTIPGSLSQVVVDAIQQEADNGQTAASSSQDQLLDDESTDGDWSESAPPATGLLREVHAEQAVDSTQQSGPHESIDNTLPQTSQAPTTAAASAPLTDTSLAAAVPSADVIVDHVPEIKHLEFRYFDGQRWHGRWDSSVAGVLPAAVEMSFELARSGPSREGRKPRPQPQHRDGNLARRTQSPATSRAPSHTLDSPTQETNPVFRSLAFIRASRRLTPPSPTEMEEGP